MGVVLPARVSGCEVFKSMLTASIELIDLIRLIRLYCVAGAVGHGGADLSVASLAVVTGGNMCPHF
jgi:hypothetical protein